MDGAKHGLRSSTEAYHILLHLSFHMGSVPNKNEIFPNQTAASRGTSSSHEQLRGLSRTR